MDDTEETKEVAEVAGDKYRSILNEDVENAQWRHGGPPIFDAVNKLFEEGRTQVCPCYIYELSIKFSNRSVHGTISCVCVQEWPKGSLEEAVQNAVKSWEMELSHKTRLQDFKTINPEKFKLFVNGIDPRKFIVPEPDRTEFSYR